MLAPASTRLAKSGTNACFRLFHLAMKRFLERIGRQPRRASRPQCVFWSLVYSLYMQPLQASMNATCFVPRRPQIPLRRPLEVCRRKPPPGIHR